MLGYIYLHPGRTLTKGTLPKVRLASRRKSVNRFTYQDQDGSGSMHSFFRSGGRFDDVLLCTICFVTLDLLPVTFGFLLKLLRAAP